MACFFSCIPPTNLVEEFFTTTHMNNSPQNRENLCKEKSSDLNNDKNKNWYKGPFMLFRGEQEKRQGCYYDSKFHNC